MNVENSPHQPSDKPAPRRWILLPPAGACGLFASFSLLVSLAFNSFMMHTSTPLRVGILRVVLPVSVVGLLLALWAWARGESADDRRRWLLAVALNGFTLAASVVALILIAAL